MVPRGAAPLPGHAHHPRGHQARSERRQGNARQAQGQEARAHLLPSGEWRGCFCFINALFWFF